MNPQATTDGQLKEMLEARDPALPEALRRRTAAAETLDELLRLATLRKRATSRGLFPAPSTELRVALLGGVTFFPMQEVLIHELALLSIGLELLVGDHDNHVAEILSPTSRLAGFGPDVVVLVPSGRQAHYTGALTDPRPAQEQAARELCQQLLSLCDEAHSRCGAEVILANFVLPAGHDLGAYRARTLGSDWSFRKLVNLELGLSAPPHVTILDLEFLAARLGNLGAQDARAWLETRQPGSRPLLVALARELAEQLVSLRRSPRKVLVLDLDNTLWGGVIGDDGVDGIELGDTSPRGEAFKELQRYVRTLKERGVLLAVASKNDVERAREPFESHPEMVLRLDDVVAFEANWGPKSESIRRIAEQLDLGLDSFVFVDDNPAEIDIVRQFCPEVATILLGDDPAEYVRQIQDCRHFEPRSITAEDAIRTHQYRQEAERRELRHQVTDMGSYLESLAMRGVVGPFEAVDVPRVTQLINKSNQFNLTTRRRTESEVRALLDDSGHVGLTVRLVDRFGDHGLISVIVCEVRQPALVVETWLMSCRVLERQVENEVLNELVRLARENDLDEIHGLYLPTPKNGMVRGLYPRLGFETIVDNGERSEFRLAVADHVVRPTAITMERRSHVTG